MIHPIERVGAGKSAAPADNVAGCRELNWAFGGRRNHWQTWLLILSDESLNCLSSSNNPHRLDNLTLGNRIVALQNPANLTRPGAFDVAH
ncbi:hypothetical protein E4U21_003816 [Claviceps maximensis]|nr:hypothetical protein E4U21_003816 [Claviceps maximensis]